MATAIVTPAEMAEIDRSAPEPIDVLIGRAGAALAREAIGMLGGTYGRRVCVVAGKGNNGNDGRVAARLLEGRGVRVAVVGPGDRDLPAHELLIDAAYGTGFRVSWSAPETRAPVLAADIASGVDGLTGRSTGALQAERTVTFGALKPGLLFGDGPAHSGSIAVANLGLDVGRARAFLVEGADCATQLPDRGPGDHKWTKAVRLVAGSPGMTGAGELAAGAALRAGAGMVVSSGVGVEAGRLDLPREAVARSLDPTGWAGGVLDDIDRFSALVVGPGIGRRESTLEEVAVLIGRAPVPVVVDADALHAIAGRPHVTLGRPAPTVVTPHEGEFAALMGTRPGPDRIDAARQLARTYGVVALLKGSSTVVADPAGHADVVIEGDQRLATAGTGDVLSGIIGTVFDSSAPRRSVAAAAFLHGRAGRLLPFHGLTAGDLSAHLGAARRSLSVTAPRIARIGS